MYHLPGDLNPQNVQSFYANQYTGATTAWQIWSKPPGKTHLFILCIGSGGGGAGGSSTTNVGGGGGASSGISRYLYSMWAIPDNLYLLVGAGGIGGAINGPGGDGQLSYVALYPDSSANNLFAVSGAASAKGAPGAGASTGGTAGTIATDAGAVFSCWAMTKYIAGANGIAGGSNASGVAFSLGTACQIYGGLGGGGNAAANGSLMNATVNTPFYSNTTTSRNGQPGFKDGNYPVYYGGEGGAAGIVGGNGVRPGTGGGGGQGAAAGPGTAGGDGGSGLVMMISF